MGSYVNFCVAPHDTVFWVWKSVLVPFIWTPLILRLSVLHSFFMPECLSPWPTTLRGSTLLGTQRQTCPYCACQLMPQQHLSVCSALPLPPPPSPPSPSLFFPLLVLVQRVAKPIYCMSRYTPKGWGSVSPCTVLLLFVSLTYSLAWLWYSEMMLVLGLKEPLIPWAQYFLQDRNFLCQRSSPPSPCPGLNPSLYWPWQRIDDMRESKLILPSSSKLWSCV